MPPNDIPIPTPVQLERDRHTREVDQANIRLEQLKKAYCESPEMKIQADRDALERMRNDPYHLNKTIGGNLAAQNEEAMLVARIRDAESAQEAERLDVAMGKKQPEQGPVVETTFGDQIPRRDHADAIATSLGRGVRPSAVETFHRTGHCDNSDGVEAGYAAAAEWQRRLMADPELQRKFLAKDPTVMREFEYYGMLRRDPRREPSE